MRYTIPLLLVFSITGFSCLQNAEDLTATDVVADISYADDIQPIFNSHCTSCHGAARNGNLALRSYSELMAGSGFRYGADLVIPGNAENSGLVDSIEPAPESGILRMPQGGPFLSPTQIQLIRTWIDEGAQDN